MKADEIKPRLREFILKDLMRNPTYPLADDEALITGGLVDSFDLAQIAVFAEREFDVYLPDSDLTVEAMDTLDRMAEQIARRGSP